jgi:serine/threonine-protein kinase RsbT
MADIAEETEERIRDLLRKYMPERSVRALLDQVRESTGTDHRDLQPMNMSAFFVALEEHAATRLDRRARALLHGELEFELATSISGLVAVAASADHSMNIRSEWDVSVARARSRELMNALGAKSYEVVKVMTLVSELARNIVRYTSGGEIVLTAIQDPKSLIVRARDQGPGIPNLNDVLSGRYRSKTGLGKGLIGVRRLATRFTIHTDTTGTHIEAEVRL